MTINVIKGDITKIKCDAIVNPANSYGVMGGGVAGFIRNIGGISIEKEATSKSPINVGEAIVTNPGKLPCRYVIHAPTMKEPAMKIGVENVRKATIAAFKLGINLKIKTIAFPGMGTGVGGVSLDDAAKNMVEIAKEYKDFFDKIIFVCYNENLYNSFIRYL